MATVAFGIIGAGIELWATGGKRWQEGWAIGTTIGGFIEGVSNKPNIEVNKLSDLRFSGSSYGAAIPRGWGKNKFSSNVIWVANYVDNKTLVPSSFALNNEGVTHLVEHKKKESGGGGGSGGGNANQTKYWYTASFAVAFCEASIFYADGTFSNRSPVIKKLWADDVLVYDADDASVNKLTIRFHYGAENEAPDTLIAQAEAGGVAANTPAFRGLVYIVIENMDLTDYGSRLPNISAEIWTSSVTLGEIAKDIFGQVDLIGPRINVAQATSPVTGYMLTNRFSGQDSLDSLAKYFLNDTVEFDGKVHLIPRESSVSATIPVSELGAMSEGTEEIKSILERTRSVRSELPGRVDITYFDVSKGYQQMTQSDIKFTANFSNPSNITLTMSLTATEARRIAASVLDTAFIEAESFNFSLSWKYLYLCPTDRIQVTDNGQQYLLRIVSMDAGEPGEINVSAVIHDPEATTQVITGDVGEGGGTNPTNAVVPVTFGAWSGYALRNQDMVSPGMYVWGTWPSNGKGGTVFFSTDGGTTWNQGPNIGTRTAIGTVSSNGSALTGHNYWEPAGTINVSLVNDIVDLGSTTQDAVLNGENVALIGNEIVGFTTVAPTGTNNYTVSYLRRAMATTPTTTTAYVSGDRFVLLTSAVQYVQINEAFVGQTVKVKVVAPGQALSDVAAVDVVIAPRTLTQVEEDLDVVEDEVADLTSDLAAHAATKASTTVLGHVKLGTEFTIDPDGTLHYKLDVGDQIGSAVANAVLYTNGGNLDSDATFYYDESTKTLGHTGTVKRSKVFTGFGSGTPSWVVYDNVIAHRQDQNVTGAWVIHSPINRNANLMFRITVKGYWYNTGDNLDFTVVGYAYSGSNGNIDGVAGAIIGYSLSDNGNDGYPKYIGVDAAGKVSIAIGNESSPTYFSRLRVECEITTATSSDFSTGWTVDQTTTAGFGWGDRRGPMVSEHWGVLTVDEVNKRTGFNQTVPDATVHIGSATTSNTAGRSTLLIIGGTSPGGIVSGMSLVNNSALSAAQGVAIAFHPGGAAPETVRVAGVSEGATTASSLKFYTHNSTTLREVGSFDSSGRFNGLFGALIAGQVSVNRASSGLVCYAAFVSGDANNRFTLDTNGLMSWGPGTGATDTSLQRAGTGILQAGGVFRTSSASDASIFSIRTSGATVKLEGGSSAGFLKTTTNHPLNLGANNLDHVQVTVDGRVFLNTSATAELVVGGTTQNQARIFITGSYSNAANMLYIGGTVATTGSIAGTSILANSRFEGFAAGSSIRNNYSVPLVGGANAPSFVSAYYGRIDLASNASFILPNARAFHAIDANLGGTGTITEQDGFYVGALSAGSKNYAFRSLIDAATDKWNLYMGGTAYNYIKGRMYMGATEVVPTARLHLGAGTSGANGAPFKFTAGSDLSSPEDGAVEFNGTVVKVTQTGGTRKTLAYTDTSFTVGQIIGLDEAVQDMISTFLTQGTGITLTYNDVGNTLSVALDTSALNEIIDDRVAALIINTQTIKKSYDDTGNTLSFNWDPPITADNRVLAGAPGGGAGTSPASWRQLESLDHVPMITIAAPGTYKNHKITVDQQGFVTHIERVKRRKRMVLAWGGFTPSGTGPDKQVRIESFDEEDDILWDVDEFYFRVEGGSAGTSSVKLQYAGNVNGALTWVDMHATAGDATITAAGPQETRITSFDSGGAISGGWYRFNVTAINAAHTDWYIEVVLVEAD